MSEEISANVEEATVPLPPTRRRLGMSHKRAGADILPPCQGTRTSNTPSGTDMAPDRFKDFWRD
jgi:hypothetical protein